MSFVSHVIAQKKVKIKVQKPLYRNKLVLPCCHSLKLKIFGSMVGWLERRDGDRHDLGSKPFAPFCCVHEKDTLQHFSLFGGLGKKF